MRAFRFRLQTVLDLKLRAEEQAQQALATAQRAVAEAEQALARLATQRRETLALPADASPEARGAARVWADALTQQSARIEEQRTYLCAAVAARRDALARAASERRAVEKLREQAWLEYQAEASRQEKLQLDEIAGTRHEWARRQEL